MPAPEEARKQVALTYLSTLPDSAKGFWWTDDDLANSCFWSRLTAAEQKKKRKLCVWKQLLQIPAAPLCYTWAAKGVP